MHVYMFIDSHLSVSQTNIHRHTYIYIYKIPDVTKGPTILTN